MAYYSHGRTHILVRRHYILLLILFLRSCGILLVVGLLYVVERTITPIIADGMIQNVRYALFFFTFVLLNYAFFKFIFWLFRYYNNVIVISHDLIAVIHCSLILEDDVELIDAARIVKVDSQAHGFFANVLWYANIVIEQQRNEVRTLHFVPHPYKFLEIIENQRQKLLYNT